MIRRHYTTTHCCSSREPLCLEFVQPGKPLVTSLWWRQGLPIQSHLPRQLSASTSLCSSGTQAVSCSKGQRSGRPRGLPAGTVDLGLSQTPLPLGHPLRCHRPLSGSHCSFPPPAPLVSGSLSCGSQGHPGEETIPLKEPQGWHSLGQHGPPARNTGQQVNANNPSASQLSKTMLPAQLLVS